MRESERTPEPQEQLRVFVSDALERYSSFRDNKEAMAYAGLALFTGAAATALASKDWPPMFAEKRPWLVISAFTLLWLFVILYLRYQLRRRRWAALRVAGCEWLLCEWLPDSPKALVPASEVTSRDNQRVSCCLLLLDHIWPLKHSVPVIDPKVSVYPKEIEDSWIRAEVRGTDALTHERLMHLAGWTGYVAVILRTLY